MGRHRWTFRGERGLHVVELEHGWFTGKRRLVVDGATIVDTTFFLDGGSDHAFEVEGRKCLVAISTNGLTYRRVLTVDGLEITRDDVVLPAVSVDGSTVPVSTTLPRAEPTDVPVKSRFIDIDSWFKNLFKHGER